jgi:hypothetical protein
MVASCTNKTSFPYRRFENTLLALHDLTSAILAVMPSKPDMHPITNRIGDLEGTRARRKAHLDLLIAEFTDHAAGPVREAAKAQIDKLGAEIEGYGRELTELRQQVRLAQHSTPQDAIQRFQEARTLINSTDPEQRVLARAKVAMELRRVIEYVKLHDDEDERRITVRIRAGAEQFIDYVLTPTRIENISRIRIIPQGMMGDSSARAYRVADKKDETFLVGTDSIDLLKFVLGSDGFATAKQNTASLVEFLWPGFDGTEVAREDGSTYRIQALRTSGKYGPEGSTVKAVPLRFPLASQGSSGRSGR